MARKASTTAAPAVAPELTADEAAPEGDGLVLARPPVPTPMLSGLYDEDTKAWVMLSDEDRRLANFLHEQVREGVLRVAVALYHLRERRLHLALGVSSWTEYVDTKLPFGERQVRKMLAIGQAFGQHYTPQLESGDSTDRQPAAGSGVEHLSSMGAEKLYELARLPEQDRDALTEKGTLTAADGTVYTWEEIEAMGRRNLSRIVADKLAPYKAKLEESQEDAAALKLERDALKKQLAEANAALAASAELEKAYRAPYATLQEKRSALDLANRLVDELGPAIVRIGVKEGDPDTLQDDLFALLSKLDGVVQRVQNNYTELRIAYLEMRG